jgi:uncharacterized protein (DUF305 family)
MLLSTAFACMLGGAGSAYAQDVPILQPGAPGQPSIVLRPEEAARIADNRFTADDVRFMQAMIPHHHQAVQMAALVNSRTNRQPLLDVAKRIDASQADEIKFMQEWLRERGQTAPDPAAGGHGAHQAGHGAGGDHAGMKGMATPEQMAALSAARGPAFERLFLERMIAHHEGAVEMGRDLLRRSGSAYDPVLAEFVNEVINEQQAEINKMVVVLASLSADPRTSLSAGYRDAGQAISNMRLVASLPKPTGFFDPANPAGLPPQVPAKEAAAGGQAPTGPDAASGGRFGQRSPQLSFANTDMAFAGDLMAAGSYHGFNLYRLDAGGQPRLAASVICPGGQGDVSIVGNLLIMSVESATARIDCGRQGITEDVSLERFRGIRIFDISNPAQPVQVGQVQTCRGSHTHSVVSETNESVIVYVSGTSSVRSEKELASCVAGIAGDQRTALFRIDVIEIPKADPSRARIIDSPAVFADAQTGQLAGLWRGGTHGEGTQDTNRTDQCHDITVFPSRNLAAGACSGNGIIFDISDPRKPRRMDAVVDPNFAYWHSATFNNDGTKVLFTDEWGGGGRPRCQAHDPRNWGANAIYDIVDGRLQFRSHQKLPAAQGERENCVAHNGSIVPVPGRDIFVQSWYQGGISVIDFTDSANPVEIAYFDRGPLSTEHSLLGGFWSSYWYDGKIYGTEIARGIDVLALTPSAHLTANEIAAAALADQGERFNPQQQFPVKWPDHPVVALAYVDQLQRGRSLNARAAGELTQALGQARTAVEGGRADARLAGRIERLAGNLAVTGDAAATRRADALRTTLRGVAARLRGSRAEAGGGNSGS